MAEENIIPWDGQVVTVQKKAIKNVYLKVLPPDGRILLSVPRSYSRKDIESVLDSRRQWLLDKQRFIKKNVKFLLL